MLSFKILAAFPSFSKYVCCPIQQFPPLLIQTQQNLLKRKICCICVGEKLNTIFSIWGKIFTAWIWPKFDLKIEVKVANLSWWHFNAVLFVFVSWCPRCMSNVKAVTFLIVDDVGGLPVWRPLQYPRLSCNKKNHLKKQSLGMYECWRRVPRKTVLNITSKLSKTSNSI